LGIAVNSIRIQSYSPDLHIMLINWSLSWARWIQFIPPLISLKIYLMLSTHLRISLPSGLFWHSSWPHSCYVPCPSHTVWLDHSNYTWRKITNYETPRYAVFSNLLSLHLSSVQIFLASRNLLVVVSHNLKRALNFGAVCSLFLHGRRVSSRNRR
jgi:hypothetical protein